MGRRTQEERMVRMTPLAHNSGRRKRVVEGVIWTGFLEEEVKCWAE